MSRRHLIGQDEYGFVPGMSKAGAVWVALTATAVLSPVLALMSLLMIRDRFQTLCWYATAGEGRGWSCPDGIAYILPGSLVIVLLAPLLFVTAFALVVRWRDAARATRFHTAIAPLSLALVVVISLAAASGQRGEPPPESWAEIMLPSVLCFAPAMLASWVSASVRSRLWSTACAGIALVLVIVGVALEPSTVFGAAVACVSLVMALRLHVGIGRLP
ncbi:hypothetical protein GCM10027416_04950 [Okibacterium endophyticum]